ncbi:M14 family zinc carboxypeptidase [Lysobacter capsici]|uniref:M14 family zinc carboxypeptidase n=3 Tax=Lysobacter capsici TaxID=435897 RepID=UPI00287BBAE6|nr:M14 family zinc carboxypeptidase [Lysobacter capsici]WND79231.1 M14 family zinc carboxypeptidase [Lysobacter capsici]WND84426.1 M14 family zinc carboxypeptidase [Lysobacter capsici]
MRFQPAALPLLLALSASAVAADDLPVFVTAHYDTPAQLQRIASRFQHLKVDRKAKTVMVEAMPADLAALTQAGFKYQVDQDLTLRSQRLQTGLQSSDAQISSIPGFACFRTVEEAYATMDNLVASKPNLARITNIGPTWQKTQSAGSGYDMRVLRLSNTATDAALPNKPTLVLFGSIHAREYAPAELVTRFAEGLVNGYGTDPEATWLLDNFAFQLVLQANPDGRKKAEAGASWRKNVNNSNGGSCSASSYGTDLNRNFPYHWNTAPGGSSGNQCAETYRGPTASSDPETQNLMRLVAGTRGSNGLYSGGIFPDRRADDVNAAAPDDTQGVFIDIHSYAELVLWPWGDTSNPPPNLSALRTLGRRMAHFNNYRPQQSSELYATDGTTTDTMYGLLGVASYAFELGGTFFESCSSFTGTTLPNNLKTLRYVARSLWAPYTLPSGPDTTVVNVSSATVPAGTPVTITANINDGLFNQSNGTEAVQNIASARAYLDAPPWASGATPIALSASDGSFNSSNENVIGNISTTGLSQGVHTVYVQGTDAAGKQGTPNAVRFTVGGTGPVNNPPVANFTSSISGLSVNFTDSSIDSDGSIASRSWNFGDGTTSTAANPSKTYSAAGTYTVSLTVTDDDGATNTKTASVTVSAGPGGTQTYSNGTDVAITDNATVESSIVVSGRSGNGGANTPVQVTIHHTYKNDIKVDLVAPDGTIYNIHNRTGGSADNVIGTFNKDLSSEPLNGTWKLRVNDNQTGDTGRIDTWSLTF